MDQLEGELNSKAQRGTNKGLHSPQPIQGFPLIAAGEPGQEILDK